MKVNANTVPSRDSEAQRDRQFQRALTAALVFVALLFFGWTTPVIASTVCPPLLNHALP